MMKRIKKSMIIALLTFSLLLTAGCFNKSSETEQIVEASQLAKNNALIIERHPAPDVIGEEEYRKRDCLPMIIEGQCDIRSLDLTACDLTKEYETLLQTTYDSKTIWPEKLPGNFDPDKIMELYKNPGLNIRSLHKKGITGKGVGIGIIDQCLLVDHMEYKEQLKYYSERITVKKQAAAMHGAAVASIAVGKNVGVAPGADLYYIAEDDDWVADDYSLMAESINKLLDINKSLPTKNKIRVISISWGLDTHKGVGTKVLNKAYQRAKEEGVLVITTSLFLREDFDFSGLDKIPLSDPDDFNSYTENLYGMKRQDMGLFNMDYRIKYNISLPMNYRCTASPTGDEDYVVYRTGGKSWATPYLAGVYALACQVKPEITYEEFFQLADSTAKTSHGIFGVQRYEAQHIIDPLAIMEKLEDNK